MVIDQERDRYLNAIYSLAEQNPLFRQVLNRASLLVEDVKFLEEMSKGGAEVSWCSQGACEGGIDCVHKMETRKELEKIEPLRKQVMERLEKSNEISAPDMLTSLEDIRRKQPEQFRRCRFISMYLKELYDQGLMNSNTMFHTEGEVVELFKKDVRFISDNAKKIHGLDKS